MIVRDGYVYDQESKEFRWCGWFTEGPAFMLLKERKYPEGWRATYDDQYFFPIRDGQIDVEVLPPMPLHLYLRMQQMFETLVKRAPDKLAKLTR